MQNYYDNSLDDTKGYFIIILSIHVAQKFHHAMVQRVGASKLVFEFYANCYMIFALVR